jgi:hypothetical protein
MLLDIIHKPTFQKEVQIPILYISSPRDMPLIAV